MVKRPFRGKIRSRLSEENVCTGKILASHDYSERRWKRHIVAILCRLAQEHQTRTDAGRDAIKAKGNPRPENAPNSTSLI